MQVFNFVKKLSGHETSEHKCKMDSVLVLQIHENYGRRAIMLISVTMVHDGSRMDMFNVVDERSCSCSCGRGGLG